VKKIEWNGMDFFFESDRRRREGLLWAWVLVFATSSALLVSEFVGPVVSTGERLLSAFTYSVLFLGTSSVRRIRILLK
jgi:hypothetical protein